MTFDGTIDPLAKLPEIIADLTSRIPGIAQSVTAASVDMWAADRWPPIITTLQSVQFNWRIRFVKDESETIFFFIQVDKAKFVALDATASISVLGAWPLEPLDPLQQNTVRRIVRLPAFLNATPSDEFVNTYKPDGGDPAQTIFFMLGSDATNVLAVSSPELGKNALLRYSPGGIPGATSKKQYPLRAFVDLSMTLRDWMAAGAQTGSAIDVIAPGTKPTPSQQILTSFADAYASCVNALRQAPGSVSPMNQRFRVSGYSVQLEMALTADGTLAQRSEDERARLGATLTISGTDPATAQTVAATPSFIVSGQLYEKIFDALVLSREAAKLASALGDKDTVVLMAFADSARSGSAIFKLGAENGSTKLLMVLSGEMQGFPELVIAGADYDGEFDFFAANEFPDDGSNVMVTFDDVGQLFLPMIAAIRTVTIELTAW